MNHDLKLVNQNNVIFFIEVLIYLFSNTILEVGDRYKII